MRPRPKEATIALHTDIPSRAQIEQLLRARQPGLVSIYLPTSPVTPEADADRIALKNLAGEAGERLEAEGVEKRRREEIAEALADLDDDAGFWAQQARSLAVFAGPGTLRSFRLPNRLSEALQVADRFYVKPLLRAVTFPQTAFVLALAEGSVRLLEVTPEGPAYEVRVPDLPDDAADAVGKSSTTDRSPARRIQGDEGRKTLLRQYARAVDRALRPVLAGHDVPLILAATQPIESIFRAVNSYPRLAGPVVEGSPEGRSDAELGEAARAVLDAVHAAELAELRGRFEERAATGRTAVEMSDLGRAATFGAVETLFADIDAALPGSLDEETGAVSLDEAEAPGDYGVVDELARRVLLGGGRVLAVRAEDVPGGGPAAAILRYPA